MARIGKGVDERRRGQLVRRSDASMTTSCPEVCRQRQSAPRRRSGVVLTVLSCLLAGCGYPKYAVREDDVVRVTVDEAYGRREVVLPGADPASFVVLIEGGWAKDATTVFRYNTPVEGALPDSFERLDERYFVDAARVYLEDEPLPGADPATFEPFPWPWSRDAAGLWHGASPVTACDPSSFGLIDDGWAADAECVYGGPAPLDGVDVASFEVLGSGYARDRNAVYGLFYRDLGAEDLARLADPLRRRMAAHAFPKLGLGARVPTADPLTFVLVDDDEAIDARDRDRCYRRGEQVDCPVGR